MNGTALYFGSFNPIHNGHTAIARYVVEQKFCEELWFVVSPQNPLKPAALLAPGEDRLRMAEIAADELDLGGRVKVCGIEFELPRPSYTIDTLRELGRRYPERTFSLLVGADISGEFERWKESEALLRDYRMLVYPRSGFPSGACTSRGIYLKGAPLWRVSSTDVRQLLAAGKKVEGLVAPGVEEYIKKRGLWT